MVDADDFTYVLRRGTRAGNKHLVLAVACPASVEAGEALSPARQAEREGARSDRRGGDLHTKIGFIVPKKQIPLAVDRNRVRRRLRHLLAGRLEMFPPGSKVVVRVMAPISELSSAQLADQLDRAIAAVKRKSSRATT